jgi:hypothetical protein
MDQVNIARQGKRLLIGGRVVARFAHPIREAFFVPKADLVVVRTGDPRNRDHRNVWAFTAAGRRRWRIGPSGRRSWQGLDPYWSVGVYDAHRLMALCMRGLVAIDASTGEISPVDAPRLQW